MLDDLQRQHDVELPALDGQRLGSRFAIVDGEALAGSVQAGRRDVAFAGVDAGDRGAQPRHRLAQQAAAAADIEHRQTLQRRARQRVALPMDGGAVADITQPQRVQAVQGRELAVGVPPLLGDAREALDLGRIDGAMRCFGHGRP